QTDPLEFWSLERLVIVPQELIARADAEKHDIGFGSLTQRIRFALDILRGNLHLAVRATVKEDQIVFGKIGSLFDINGLNFCRDPAPLTTFLDRKKIAPISRDAHQCRVEMPYFQHHTAIFYLFGHLSTPARNA